MCLYSFACAATETSGSAAHLLAMQVFVWMNDVDAQIKIFSWFATKHTKENIPLWPLFQ